MKKFLFNLFLALTWCLLTGSASPWNFVAGFLVGVVVVSAYSNVTGQGYYVRRWFEAIAFVLYFLGILVKANVQIAKECVTPGFSQKPRILRYPVSHLSQIERTTLANAITLTPGTLVLDISPDGNWLYIHCMYAENPAVALKEIDELAAKLRKGIFAA
jgi:multicomponent Na+:H+ antiporter subunit E